MMCYPSTGYIMFSLKKLKFHRVRGPGAGVRGLDMRARVQITQTPLIKYDSCKTFLRNIFVLSFSHVAFNLVLIYISVGNN